MLCVRVNIWTKDIRFFSYDTFNHIFIEKHTAKVNKAYFIEKKQVSWYFRVVVQVLYKLLWVERSERRRQRAQQRQAEDRIEGESR